MKSVGEVMAIGRTFKESLFKALRSLEALRPWRPGDMTEEELRKGLSVPSDGRVRLIVYALEKGMSVEEVNRLTHVDPWFLDQMQQMAALQAQIRGQKLEELTADLVRQAKEYGFSDRRLGHLCGADTDAARERRRALGVKPVFKRVDTCAAEFESFTPYLYSTYEEEDESAVEDVKKVVILGSGPNRIGQGIEFDYCCCHAAFALREAGVQSIMVNCNPETVSTDYDTSDRLYFEPLTVEDTLEIIQNEKPDGVIVQFGGQTPLNLTGPLAKLGVPILGTSNDSIDLAEDRERFNAFLDKLGIRYPEHGFADTPEEAEALAERIGYPVLVRPSYVLGGRAMAIVYERSELHRYVKEAFDAAPQGRVLIDQYLEDAFELDVDALSDGKDTVVAGIMQHFEEAGVHSGDSSCALPVYRIEDSHLEQIRDWTREMAKGLNVVGVMNVQYAIHGDRLYVIEVNPRASRTVPFIAKATGVPLVKYATQLMLGKTLQELGFTEDLQVEHSFVKAPVFPFMKFLGVDPKLSPEMRSTGEVMGIADNWGMAYYKAQLAAGTRLPSSGTVLVTVNRRDHEGVVPTARRLIELGFKVVATSGTAASLRASGLDVGEVLKRSEGRPNCVDAIRNGEIDLIINTPLGSSARKDGREIRTAAVQHQVPCVTTLSGAAATVEAIASMVEGSREVKSLQEL
jgi:carbamoyl-phosphate synthase large subunit